MGYKIMEQLLTYQNFTNSSIGAIPILEATVTAVPVMFPVILFLIWLLGTASSYYAILKTTGRKRFWNALTAMSFVTFILSLILVTMNTTTTTFLSGYWVAFYIIITVGSWFMMVKYK